MKALSKKIAARSPFKSKSSVALSDAQTSQLSEAAMLDKDSISKSIMSQQENLTSNHLQSSSIASVQLTAVNKYYDNFQALKNINLTIEDGEFISFLGPSGCGKTTLLRTIAGLESCEQGAILLSGKDVTDLPARKRDFGIVFQSYALFPNLSVSDNIAYALKSGKHKQTKSAIKARVCELIELVGLDGLADRYPAQLSGGQQQRVALARALAARPKLLLLDEPLSALDAKVRHNLRAELKSLQQKTGITTIMVTHDQEEALAISDRIAVLNQGTIEQVGTPDEIYTSPATPFVAEFVGTINRIGLNSLMAVPNDITQINPEFTPNTEHLVVRPEWISLHAEPASQRHQCQILDLEYRGATIRIGMSSKQLMHEGTIYADIATQQCKQMGLEPGQTAWIEINHRELCTPSY